MNEIKLSGMVNSNKNHEEWFDDFIEWTESRGEFFGGGVHLFKEKPLKDFINKEVFVVIEISDADQTFTRRLKLNWDSLKEPHERLVAHDKKGNAVFIMLEEMKK